MKRNDRVLVTWHSLNFCVPMTKEDKAMEKAQMRQRNNSFTKQVKEQSLLNIKTVGKDKRRMK